MEITGLTFARGGKKIVSRLDSADPFCRKCHAWNFGRVSFFVFFVPGFRYNLGFSGSTYQMNASTDEEKLADSLLIENRYQFWWFPHMWYVVFYHFFLKMKKYYRKIYNFFSKIGAICNLTISLMLIMWINLNIWIWNNIWWISIM